MSTDIAEDKVADQPRVQLKKSDLIKHWLLGYSSETAYNYERLQALGTANAMVPIIRRLYPQDQQAEELKKYMVFFNTEPSYMGTVIHGVAASMEERRAQTGGEVTDSEINSVRTGLMGPVAGIGDTVSQGIVYPILAGLACQLAIAGNFAGPILFEVLYKAIMLTLGYTMYMMGYKQGKTAILRFLKAGTLNRITEVFSIIGLMVVGNMAASRVNIMTPVNFKVGEVPIVLQDVMDSLLPGMLPLAATLLVWWLVAKKLSPTWIIGVIFVFGIVCSLLGLLGVPTA